MHDAECHFGGRSPNLCFDKIRVEIGLKVFRIILVPHARVYKYTQLTPGWLLVEMPPILAEKRGVLLFHSSVVSRAHGAFVYHLAVINF